MEESSGGFCAHQGPRGRVASGSNAFTAPAGFFEGTDAGRGTYLSTAFGDNYRTVASVGTANALSASGAPAVAGSGQIDWAVNTIPPLTLSRGSTASGGITFKLDNSYDPHGRLARIVITTANAANTTTYTAWDRFGRPTAGTLVSPQSHSTLALVYDDLARTLTTTTTTGSIVAVGRDTYDYNGNSVLLEYTTPSGTSTTTSVFHAMAVQCQGGINPPPSTPGSGRRTVAGTFNITFGAR